MVRFALLEFLAPNVRLLSAANGAAVVSSPPHRIRYRVDARRWLTPSFSSPASCRIRKFHSRCSNVNSDVQFNHVVSDDKFFLSEGSSIQGDFLAPVVQHNSEILETPSFGLLVETTYADGLLLSDLSKQVIFRFPSGSCSGTVCYDENSCSHGGYNFLGPWFVVLVLAASIEKLCGLALGIANERDWVVQLAGISRPIALAQANAVLSRIDLLAEIAGTSMFGVLLSKYGPVMCLKFSYTLMIGSLQ
ncbi:unnamed protein product [Linum trigynum]|uniref:Solute carrier family 40 member n=1 Tax=Linum trigynum TaxID=586398 RepID=A0AAV2GAF9_9ROSI